MTLGRPIDILLVEDNPTDVELTKEMLEHGKLSNVMHNVTDGAQALAYLRREGEYAAAGRPDLVLLDLNLPILDGRAVLSEMKQDPALRDIPVVVLTTSEAENDIIKSYQLHANCYITKPVDLNKFAYVVRSIESFWLTVVRLPGRSE